MKIFEIAETGEARIICLVLGMGLKNDSLRRLWLMVDNDQLRILTKHSDPDTAKWVTDLLNRRVKRYSAAEDMNRGNIL